jgi:hypothetical protein
MSTSASLIHTYTQVNRNYEILSTRKPTLVSKGGGERTPSSVTVYGNGQGVRYQQGIIINLLLHLYIYQS